MRLDLKMCYFFEGDSCFYSVLDYVDVKTMVGYFIFCGSFKNILKKLLTTVYGMIFILRSLYLSWLRHFGPKTVSVAVSRSF